MSQPSRSVDYFFTMSSPWTFFGHGRFIALAQRHGLGVAMRPIPLLRLFPETGGLPAPRRHPTRQRYRLVELQRWSAALGIPVNPRPKFFPFDVALLDHVVVAMGLAGHDANRFMALAWAGIWQEERDLADPAVIAELLALAGAPAGMLEAAGRAATLARYEENLAAALAAGVFGAPTYGLDGELFWGQDRLTLLDATLVSGRAPYRAD
ncbi:MAG TPA: 2-hydroxychromene-2-carboxylate isomerase [Acidiphilium sp.]|nr:MAG: disulfide bond formation protein DsbA [Acidiphilium sp. 21-60-14]OYV89922.1 MAG: disulfide bond formation protein DsbA [Acidiphilium sp. 37-60-79]OZB39097.1 MAG: disulfide bond formation protein DsbA [Acidiphilium sp. 34-60-192]HQT89452.1 2-hydroxychromene-2-carboxylate isomerase [Acidiphilium sp.]HQU24708.1 2-hydroxychromene-2-carboxylate isomerase [Acidiphilium sp.]